MGRGMAVRVSANERRVLVILLRVSRPVSSRPTPYAVELRRAPARALFGVSERELARATDALVGRYRAVAPAAFPILATGIHVAAYAAYRMPATHAALARVLADVERSGFAPRG